MMTFASYEPKAKRERKSWYKPLPPDPEKFPVHLLEESRATGNDPATGNDQVPTPTPETPPIDIPVGKLKIIIKSSKYFNSKIGTISEMYINEVMEYVAEELCSSNDGFSQGKQDKVLEKQQIVQAIKHNKKLSALIKDCITDTASVFKFRAELT